MKQLNEMDLDNVVGGYTKKEFDPKVKMIVDQMFPKKEINCAGCGEKISVTDYSKVAMGLIGDEYARISHYNRYCENCKKDHLWPGDTYDKETGKIVKFSFKNFKKANINNPIDGK